jgi:hypothetical protein
MSYAAAAHSVTLPQSLPTTRAVNTGFFIIHRLDKFIFSVVTSYFLQKAHSKGKAAQLDGPSTSVKERYKTDQDEEGIHCTLSFKPSTHWLC